MTSPGSVPGGVQEGVVPDVLVSLVEKARAEGRLAFDEAEGMELLSALGFHVPAVLVLESADAVVDLSGFPGSQVVVKLLSHEVAHRTEEGGVRVVLRTSEAVTDAMKEMAARSPDLGARYLVAEFVEHDVEPGGELLLSVRWTDEFGPVVHIALGGVTAEALAASALPGTLGATFSPVLDQPGAVSDVLASRPLGLLATGRDRGRAGRTSLDEIASAVHRFLDLARVAMPSLLTEVEVNPLVFRDGEAWALDALVRVAPAPAEGRTATVSPADRSQHAAHARPARHEAIHRLLHPETVAVMGVSQGMNPGRAILQNLLAGGFPTDSVQVVKPGLDELDGCRCVSGLQDLEPSVDVLVLSVAAGQVPDIMQEVVEGCRARSVILISGGLEEGGGDSGDKVRAMLGGDGAPVVNGGNCLGIRSVPGRFDTLFIPAYKLGFPDVEPHPVAVLSQSGAFAIARMSGLPWMNPRYLVTVGNQMDVTIGEYLEHLAEDDAVRVFACYVEGFPPGDGQRFLRAARRISRSGRAVVLYRAGRTPSGRDAAASHTASMAGDFAVTRELAGQAGVLVADTLEDYHDLVSLAVLLDQREVAGRRVGALSNAGFECVAMADRLGMLELAELGAGTAEALGAVLASHRLEGIVEPRNPLDVTPILTDAAFGDAAQLVLCDPAVDVGVVGCVPLTPALNTLTAASGHQEDLAHPEGVVASMRALWGDTTKAWICVVDAGPRYDDLATSLLGVGIPTFRTADRALRALERYVDWRLATG